MTDATGHMDRPGAGPDSTNEFVDGIPSNHYTHQNRETGKIEVVKVNPPGVPDTVVKEFDESRSCSALDSRCVFGRTLAIGLVKPERA
jgi:hypothetical protein